MASIDEIHFILYIYLWFMVEAEIFYTAVFILQCVSGISSYYYEDIICTILEIESIDFLFAIFFTPEFLVYVCFYIIIIRLL